MRTYTIDQAWGLFTSQLKASIRKENRTIARLHSMHKKSENRQKRKLKRFNSTIK